MLDFGGVGGGFNDLPMFTLIVEKDFGSQFLTCQFLFHSWVSQELNPTWDFSRWKGDFLHDFRSQWKPHPYKLHEY